MDRMGVKHRHLNTISFLIANFSFDLGSDVFLIFNISVMCLWSRADP